jgi:putative exporter of polyketide antibiotics
MAVRAAAASHEGCGYPAPVGASTPDDSGSPVRRASFVLASLLVLAVAELAVLLAGLAGAVLGATFSEELRANDLAHLVWAPVQYAPLALFVAACAVWASAVSSTRGRALGLAVGVAVFGYLLNVISGLISSLDWLHWCTPFGYYEPARALSRGPDMLAMLALCAASAASSR